MAMAGEALIMAMVMVVMVMVAGVTAMAMADGDTHITDITTITVGIMVETMVVTVIKFVLRIQLCVLRPVHRITLE